MSVFTGILLPFRSLRRFLRAVSEKKLKTIFTIFGMQRIKIYLLPKEMVLSAVLPVFSTLTDRKVRI